MPEATLSRQSTELSDLIGSVQGIEATHRAYTAISARFGRGDTNRVDGAVEIFPPEAEKAGEDGKPRYQVEPLPDVTLQKVRMIGQVVEDLGRGEAINGNELLESCDTMANSFRKRVSLRVALPAGASWNLMRARNRYK